ncbi:fimbrial protein [Achromobacter spanius]|uniref:fimbrial protein n=1 Tax=Achromobacter spanius TaxID=217203 RepID=UPI0037F288FB
MKLVCAMLALAAIVFAPLAHADCRKINPEDESAWMEQGLADGTVSYFAQRRVYFSGAVIDVEASLPVGSPITTGSSLPEGKVYTFLCLGDAGGTMHFDLMGAPGSAGQDIYATGIPGVGYRVIYRRASGSVSVLPVTLPYSEAKDGFVAIAAGNVFDIELIKTGPMESQSVVNLGGVAYGYGGADGAPAFEVIAQPVTLRVLPHCQVTSSKPLLVDFGPFGPRDVSANHGPDKPVVIDVACDGPTPPNSVSATLMAQPAPEATDFIRNDGTATGLAIRLQDTATREILRPQDLTSVLSKSSPGFHASFELEASVRRVGGTAPTAGSIDAQAVVTLTFL